MTIYNKNFHAKRVLKMMEREDVCSCCPAMVRFGKAGKKIKKVPLANAKDKWNELSFGVCSICQSFVGLRSGCPCITLGKEEAIKRTWLALEEGGYLEEKEGGKG